jgi:hypothetical protein
MRSRIRRLSLRHCETSKFKLRHRRGLIRTRLRRQRALCCRNVSKRELRRRMRGLGSLLGNLSESALDRAGLSRRSSGAERRVQRGITVSASLANRSAFNRAVFSRVARASVSYSVTAARPSCVRSSFLNFLSAHRRAWSGCTVSVSCAATMPQMHFAFCCFDPVQTTNMTYSARIGIRGNICKQKSRKMPSYSLMPLAV